MHTLHALSVLFIVSFSVVPYFKPQRTDKNGNAKDLMCGQYAINNLMQSSTVTRKDMFNAAKELEKKAIKETLRNDIPFCTERHGYFQVEVLIKVLENHDYHTSYITKALDEYFTDKDLIGFLVCEDDYHWFCLRLVGGKWYEMNKNPKYELLTLEKDDLMAKYPGGYTMLSVTTKSETKNSLERRASFPGSSTDKAHEQWRQRPTRIDKLLKIHFGIDKLLKTHLGMRTRMLRESGRKTTARTASMCHTKIQLSLEVTAGTLVSTRSSASGKPDKKEECRKKLENRRFQLGKQIEEVLDQYRRFEYLLDPKEPSIQLFLQVPQLTADRIFGYAQKLDFIRNELDEAQREIIEEMAALDMEVDDLHATRKRNDDAIINMQARMLALHKRIPVSSSETVVDNSQD